MNIKLLGYFFKNKKLFFITSLSELYSSRKKMFKYPVKVIGFQCVKLLLMLKQF